MTTHRLAVCSWSLRPNDPGHLARMVGELGLPAVQLDLTRVVRDPAWSDAIAVLAGAGLRVISGMMATKGEDYSTLESIARTGGLRPTEHWLTNRDHALEVASVAAEAGLPLVTFHAGFIPEDAADPERAVMIDRLQRISDVFGRHGIHLALETGQETAATLVELLRTLDRPSIGVNFDPANMILYGKGDPIAAFEELGPWVKQVHIKDAISTRVPGTWGREVRAGRGEVDWPAFFDLLARIDRPIDLVIEREAGDDRLSDIRGAIELVRRRGRAS